MPWNNCKGCRGYGTTGWLWWSKPCEACGGDGRQKPPGWPDREAMARMRPKLPMVSPPPPRKPEPLQIVLIMEGSFQRRCVKCHKKTGHVFKDAPGLCPKCSPTK
jgi:hypothetical protein